MSRTTLTAAEVAAAIAASGYYDRAWADGLATSARHMDKTRPGKRSRNSSHKQNARKAKKGGTR
jgi:hypothetical protein